MIAITGANGFLGSYIVDRLPYPQKRLIRHAKIPPDSSSECQWIQGDLRNKKEIRCLIEQAPTLIHLACTSNPRTSNQNIFNDINQNLLPTLQLFETFASAHPGGHIIFTSSGGNMYDANDPHILRHENDIPLPRSSYAIHKLTLEHYLRQFCEMYHISGTILRISNPYGTLLSASRAQGLIGVAFAKILAGEELSIFDSLDTVRDYIHLEDLVRAFQLILQHPPLSGECRLFNVSSGCGFTNAAVLDLIETTTSIKIKKHYLFSECNSPTWSILSYAKIQSMLGWKPTLSLSEGVKMMWENLLKKNNPIHSYANF